MRGEPAFGMWVALVVLAVVPLGFSAWPAAVLAGDGPVISGVVRDANGTVSGARVRVKTTEVLTSTNRDGRFELPWAGAEPVTVTAWAHGYYVGWVSAVAGGAPVEIMLNPYYTTDNEHYDWFSDEGADGSLSCSHCMPAYKEWVQDAHGQSAVNPRFLTMYNGTDVEGNQSPPTRFVYIQDYGRVPLPPDPSKPYFGPGYKLDFAATAGNCATCHVPVQAARPAGPYVADPNFAEGVDRDGVSCELCHKIGEVILDPLTQRPYPDRPGVLSLRLFRPYAGQQLFFGNFDDVTRRVSYLPLEEQSTFCAPCHTASFWGVSVYDSYGEWLDSPYNNPETGKTCQACHMPTAGYDYFVFPEKGGLHRNSSRIFSHLMPGARDEQLLRNAVSVGVDARVLGDELRVEVRITNNTTGHHVPTDSPLRHLILLVSARDKVDRPLRQLKGPVVPAWGGVGDPSHGNYAGLPGTAYAKVLQELWTEVTPTGAYWNHTRLVSDNRIAAFATAISEYRFACKTSGVVRVRVTLLFRRAFKALADQKKWQDPDIVMEERRIVLRRGGPNPWPSE
jgi:hypothetical protein